MVTTPVLNALTTPDVEPTLAIVGALLDQTPPGVASDNVIAVPAHIRSGPEIGAGAVLTVTTVVEMHPVVSAYVILVVPTATAVTIPEVSPTVATPGVPDVQNPPAAVFDSVVVPGMQIIREPVIGGGAGLTVITAVAKSVGPTA